MLHLTNFETFNDIHRFCKWSMICSMYLTNK